MNSKNEEAYRDALVQIADVANRLVNHQVLMPNGTDEAKEESDQPTESIDACCTIKSLPERLQEKAADVARRINPVNAPAFMTAFAPDQPMNPQFLTLLTTKYWGPTPRRLTVSFMESTPADLRRRILSHMNAWNVGISFVWTAGTGQVRISRGAGGYWSYLGTDVLLIPANRPTMNLQGFTMNTPETEYRRVVRHETGHTLGFPHEHMRKELIARLDREKTYIYFWETQGWDRRMVDQQVLTPLNERSIFGTPADQTSIMCYRLPGSITLDGRPITGGMDINATDFAFASTIYPKSFSQVSAETHDHSHHAPAENWEPSEDVEVALA